MLFFISRETILGRSIIVADINIISIRGGSRNFLGGLGGGGGPNLPDHKVTITQQSQDCETNSKVIIKGAGRVSKGIFGIRDLTKLRCGIREDAKYLDGKRNLNATREAGFIKICTRDVGFFSLCVGNLGNHDDSNTRSSGKCDLIIKASVQLCLLGIWEIMTTQIHVLAANAT